MEFHKRGITVSIHENPNLSLLTREIKADENLDIYLSVKSSSIKTDLKFYYRINSSNIREGQVREIKGRTRKPANFVVSIPQQAPGSVMCFEIKIKLDARLIRFASTDISKKNKFCLNVVKRLGERLIPSGTEADAETPIEFSDKLNEDYKFTGISSQPAFLIPCHIETRIIGSDLKIRIFPDQFVIDSHERLLTKEEMETGLDLLIDPEKAFHPDYEAKYREKWRQLVGKYKNDRAAWIAREAWSIHSKNDSYVYNNDDGIKFPEIALLPDFFIVTLHLDNGSKIRRRGNQIQREPLKIIHPTDQGLLEGGSKWVSDFDQAIDIGMALIIDLKIEEFVGVELIEKITVSGLRSNAGQTELLQLLEAQHYTEGIDFLKYGMATNNTEVGNSDFNSQEDSSERYNREYKENADETNAKQLSRALGFSEQNENLFYKWDNSENLENKWVEDFHSSLWPSTGGYFLLDYLPGIIDDANKRKLEEHFTKWIRPTGALPSIRIANTPYSILATSRLPHRGWIPSEADSKHLNGKAYKWFEFDQGLSDILSNMVPLWLEASKSDKVPKIFSEDSDYTVDEDLIRILSMTPQSTSYALRPYLSRHILLFMGHYYFFGPLFSGLSEDEKAIIWNEVYSQSRIRTFLNNISGTPIEALQYPSKFFDIHLPNILKSPMPLVRHVSDEELSQPWDDEDGSYEHDNDPLSYIPRLYENENVDVSENYSDTLLFKLLHKSKAADTNKSFNPPRDELSKIDLDSLFKGVLDSFTYRLDTWISSLSNKRLESIRALQNGDGLAIGMYGFVENLRINQTSDPKNRGFIHSPSLSHAVTATILKNGFNTHKDTLPNPYRFNLSSDRVTRALAILQGMRAGQEIGALLGYLFERLLHDGGADQFKDEFRNAFNFEQSDEETQEEDDSSIEESDAETEVDETLEDIADQVPRNVVNGLKLSNAESFSFDLTRIIDDNEVVASAIFYLRDTMDAISDLMMHEGVYQAVKGNYERLDAALDLVSGKGNPIEPESLQIDLIKTDVELGINIMLDASDNEITDPSPRESAEPILAKWFSGLLGDLELIECSVTFFLPTEIEESIVAIETGLDDVSSDEITPSAPEPTKTVEIVSLNDLSLKPIDFMYLSTRGVGDGQSELESRIKHHIRTLNPTLTENNDYPILIDFNQPRDEETTEESTDESLTLGNSFSDAIELAKMAMNSLAQFKYLSPNELIKFSAEADPSVRSEIGFNATDLDEIKTRYSDAFTDLVDINNNLSILIKPLKAQIKYIKAIESIGLSIQNTIKSTEGITDLAAHLRALFEEQLITDFSDSLTTIFDTATDAAIESLINPEINDDYKLLKNVAADYEQLMKSRLLVIYRNEITDIYQEEIDAGRDLGGHDTEINSVIASADEWDDTIEAINSYVFEQSRILFPQIRLFGIAIDFHPIISANVVFSVKKEINKRLKLANKAYQKWEALHSTAEQDFEAQIDLMIEALKAIFGNNFVALPTLTIPAWENSYHKLSHQNQILKGKPQDRIYLWLQQVSQTHNRVQKFEDFLLFNEAWNSSESSLQPYIVTHEMNPGILLPCWQALDNEELGLDDNSERPKGTYGVCLFTDLVVDQLEGEDTTEVPTSQLVAGFHIDRWTEALPHGRVETGIAFEADTPNQQPPNCCLLAIPPERGDSTGYNESVGDWKYKDLEGIVADTLDLAKIRSVDLDAYPDLGGLFPALFIPPNDELANRVQEEVNETINGD